MVYLTNLWILWWIIISLLRIVLELGIFCVSFFLTFIVESIKNVPFLLPLASSSPLPLLFCVFYTSAPIDSS